MYHKAQLSSYTEAPKPPNREPVRGLSRALTDACEDMHNCIQIKLH